MSRGIKEQLDALREHDQLNPDHVWVEKQRGLLLRQIKATTQDVSAEKRNVFGKAASGLAQLGSMFVPRGLALAARPVMTFLLVIGLAVGGWAATVSASYGSLPGDRLYQVKIAAEKVQKAVSGISSSDEESIQKDIERAKRRSEEILDAVKEVKNDPEKKEKVSKAIKEVAVKELQDSLDSAEQKIQEMAQKEGSDVVKVAKQVSEETREMKDNLKEAARESVDSLEDEDAADGDSAVENTADVVVQTAKAVEDVGINAIATAVDKKGEEEEVKALVKDMIDQKIQAFLHSADELRKANEELESLEKSSPDTMIVRPESGIATATTTIVITPSSMAENFAEELDRLLEENKLVEIISIVREVSQTTIETESVTVKVRVVVDDAKVDASLSDGGQAEVIDSGVVGVPTTTATIIDTTTVPKESDATSTSETEIQ
jgi:hypothetical protein